MKTKTDAAKVLLDAGWTIEEVNAVLESRSADNLYPSVIIVESPFRYTGHWWRPTITSTITANTNGISYTFDNAEITN